MANKRVSYGDIEQLLESEGFERTAVDGPHALFSKKHSRAAIVLPVRPASAPAHGLHIELARRTLIDFGILTAGDFDRWLADPKHFQAA